MTLKKLWNLEKDLNTFRKEFYDDFDDDEYQSVYEARMVVMDRYHTIANTPEGQAELLANRTQECPID